MKFKIEYFFLLTLQNKNTMECITLTFGDCAENHRGMQKIGKEGSVGLSFEDLQDIEQWFSAQGKKCHLIDLKYLLPEKEKAEPAFLLIVQDGCSALTDKNALLSEQLILPRDTKAFMYGRVVNKKARHNLCFSDFDQEANFEEGKGTVVSFARLPRLNNIRQMLGLIGGGKLEGLQCEGNYYYDIEKTYIGFHGDTERRIVVAVRLGADFPIHFQWFQDSVPTGDMFSFVLSDGDMYFMSEKAVGFDWKMKSKLTLRHAAGPERIVKTW